MFDPIFNLVADLLAWFYSLVPSYGFAIIALTTLVLVLFSPLTYKSTKSLLAQRQLQPQVKKLQKKYKGDREKMNQELMALYQEHGVTPLSGCLPILIQSPIFLVMFRVFRGITRRTTEVGFSAGFETALQAGAESDALPRLTNESGQALFQVRRNGELIQVLENNQGQFVASDGSVFPDATPLFQDITAVQDPRIFNPENLDTSTQMYICLLYTSPSPRDATLSRMPSSA